MNDAPPPATPNHLPVSDTSARTTAWTLAAVTFLPFLARFALAAHTPLSPDEAYYAAWSRDLSASYFDHPPAVAFLIRAATSVFGESAWAVRIPAMLVGALLPLFLFGATRALGASRRAALTTTLAAAATLFFSAASFIVTPDTPLVFAIAAAAFFAARGAQPGGAPFVLAAGLALAFATFSKLTGLLFSMTYFVLPGLGSWPRRAVVLALSLLGLVPVLVWNAQHDFPMFAYHSSRVTRAFSFAPQHAFEFLGAQAALLAVTPTLWIAKSAWAAWRANAGVPRAFVLWGALPFAATLALSFVTKVEANWIGAAFVPLFVVVAPWLDTRAVSRERFVVPAVAATLTLLAHLHVAWPFLPLEPARDPTAQLRHGPALAAIARSELRGEALPVLANRYQEAALLAFYLPSRRVATLEGGPRKSQYDLWPTTRTLREAPRALCVWREGEGRAIGRRITLPSLDARMVRCTPRDWRIAR